MSQKKYSIVIPAYNEAAIIEKSLVALADYIHKDGNLCNHTEVIVVTADSTDGTEKLVSANSNLFDSFKLVRPGKKVGKGRDVRAGILEATGDYVIFTDADLATPLHHLAKAFSLLEKGSDIVIGVRPLSKVHNNWTRRLRSVLSNTLIKIVAVPGISDTQCGFKGFKGKVARALFEPLETMAWGFDIEILARARARGYIISKLRINDWFDPKIGKMGLAGESDLHANWNTLKELIQIGFKRLGGRYKS